MENKDDKISFKTIWSGVMAIVYYVLAYLVLFTTRIIPYSFTYKDSDNDEFIIVRVFLGIAFVLYGLFRTYRVIKFKK